MKISCVVLFYERDRKYLETLVDNINKNLSIEHEIILIDNRDDKSEVIDIPTTVVHQMKCNMLQFEARRWSVQFCSGDFVWFIDADDKILPVSNKLEMYADYDEIVFSHNTRSGKRWQIYDRDYYFSKEDKDPFSVDFYYMSNEVVWNKWMKTSVLLECVKEIPEGLRIGLFEDNIYCMLMARKIKSAVILKDVLYEYNDDVAQHIHFSLDSLQRILGGFNQFCTLVDDLFTTDELVTIGKFDYLVTGCGYVLEKYSFMPEKDKSEARKIILKNFDFSSIIVSNCIDTPVDWMLSYLEMEAEKKGKGIYDLTLAIKEVLEGDNKNEN